MNSNYSPVSLLLRKLTGKATLQLLLLTGFLLLTYSCQDEKAPPEEEIPEPELPVIIPATCLMNNEIIIKEIAGIPEHVTFNRIKAEISGNCWEVIDAVEAVYKEGKAVLSLPQTFPAGKLQTVVRVDNDMCGHWSATSDDNNAQVAALKDIFAYNNDERVGRLYLTDWVGEGSNLHKSYIYYHYADRPFTLSGADKSFNYAATFSKGWNAYANLKKSESFGKGSALCTTDIAEDAPLVWRFETQKY